MGYIEETGVAQHYRDIRIAAIYEGTNGIQAMDLVGRKLPMRAGGVMADFLAAIEATAADLAGADGDLAVIGKRLADAHASLKATTDWLMANGVADPNNALAGATPYLRMCGIVTGGWLMARSARAAQRLLDEGSGDADFLDQKLVSAKFYAEQILPQAAGLAPAVTAGPADLLAASF
jgi:3-(methylthio)propanoyl-CoA dehydrogenase